MKTQNFRFVTALLLSAAMISCTNEIEKTETNETIDKEPIVLGASLPSQSSSMKTSDNTRVTFEDFDNGTGVTCTWADNDKLNVIDADADNAKAELVLESGHGTSDATFIGSLPTVEDNHKLYAYYPTGSSSHVTIEDGSNAATIDYSAATQDGTLASCNASAVMFGSVDYKSPSYEECSNIYMNQISTLLRIKVNIGSKKTIQTVTLSGVDVINKNVFTPDESTTITNIGTWGEGSKGDVSATLDKTDNAAETDDNGKKAVYLLIVPQTLPNGYTITATTTDGCRYSYTRNKKSTFKQGLVHTINSDYAVTWEESKPLSFAIDNYYQWDAYAHFEQGTSGNTTWGEGSEACNSTPVISDNKDTQLKQNLATTPLFKQCVTAYDIKKYLGAGVYWDNGTDVNNDGNKNMQTYSVTYKENGEVVTQTYHKGLWMMKKEYISSSTPAVETVSTTENSELFHRYARPQASEIYKYFFLPAAGFYAKDGSKYEYGGQRGFYQSGTPYTLNTFSYNLIFMSSKAKLENNLRSFGSIPFIEPK